MIEHSFYLLFSLVPLILTPFNYELFEFNKMLLTFFLTVIIVGAWLIRMVLERRVIFRRTFLDLPLAFFLFSQILSTIFSIDRHTSLFGYYSRFNGGLFSIIAYILLYYAFVSNMTAQQTLCALRYGLYSATLVAAYGILEHFGIDAQYWVQDVRNRVFSTLGQPNWLAGYLVALMPLTWGFGRTSKFGIWYLVFGIFYLCLLYTKSRSGLLGFGASFLVFWGLGFLKEKKKVLRPFLLFTFAILLLTLLVGTPSLAAEETPLITPSGEIRKIVWKGAIEVWRHHPLLGTGPETFAYSYYWHRPREHNDTSEWDFLYNKAHNEYLNYLATTGILGLGSYLLIIVSFIFWSLKKLGQLEIRSIRNSLLAGFAGLLASHFFGFSVVVTNLYFFLFPAMAFTLTSKKQKRPQPINLTIPQYLNIFFILFVICYLSFVIFKIWYADYLFAQGKKYDQVETTAQAIEFYQKSVRLNPSEPFFKIELANAASLLALEFHLYKEASAAAQLADFAVEESDQALKISPYHLNYWKTRARMFYTLAQIDKNYYQDALKTLLQAAKLAPTDAKVFFNLGSLYYHLDQKDKAIQTMKKTVELKPNYEAAIKKLEEWYNEQDARGDSL